MQQHILCAHALVDGIKASRTGCATASKHDRGHIQGRHHEFQRQTRQGTSSSRRQRHQSIRQRSTSVPLALALRRRGTATSLPQLRWKRPVDGRILRRHVEHRDASPPPRRLATPASRAFYVTKHWPVRGHAACFWQSFRLGNGVALPPRRASKRHPRMVGFSSGGGMRHSKRVSGTIREPMDSEHAPQHHHSHDMPQ